MKSDTYITLVSNSGDLGTNINDYGSIGGYPFYFFWTDSGSNFWSPSATAINGASLVNGSMDGRIRVAFNGSLQFDGLSLGGGMGSGSSILGMGGIGPVIDSIAISHVSTVPEPETSVLFLAGLGLIGAIRHKDHRSTRGQS